jgi:hypothetical protein
MSLPKSAYIASQNRIMENADILNDGYDAIGQAINNLIGQADTRGIYIFGNLDKTELDAVIDHYKTTDKTRNRMLLENSVTCVNENNTVLQISVQSAADSTNKIKLAILNHIRDKFGLKTVYTFASGSTGVFRITKGAIGTGMGKKKRTAKKRNAKKRTAKKY